MNKVNFDDEMRRVGEQCAKNGRAKLLLHSCCAPCSTACIERLLEYFDITVYYYNPNIDTAGEYAHRASEQAKYCEKLGVNSVIEQFSPDDFYGAVKGRENDAEGGERCFICYRLRLQKTAEFASVNGFDLFATTLTVSPLKNAEKLNEIGAEIAREIGVKYLPTDFKKRGGYLRSIQLSKENDMYRQNYCGCVFSKNQTKIN